MAVRGGEGGKIGAKKENGALRTERAKQYIIYHLLK